jgi:GNAT superfamily N-acetyltransferase
MKGYQIYQLTTVKEAKRVADFLLSPVSFDDKLTPGEKEDAKNHPLASLDKEKSQYWYVENEQGQIIAVNGVKEDEHRNGGFKGAFLAVAKGYRQRGIASQLFDIMLDYVKDKQGRYLLIDTSDRDEYQVIRHILQQKAFEEVGYFPNYYYVGEGTYWFYKSMIGGEEK